MCDRLRRGVIAALILGASGTAQAQTAAEFRQRLEALSRSSRQISETLATLNSTPAPLVDTIRTGGLLVVAARSVSGRARAGVDSAWERLARTYGTRANAAAGTPIVLQYEDQVEGELPFDQAKGIGVPIPISARVDLVADRIVTGASPTIYRTADRRLQDWAPHPPNPSILEANTVALYAEMATSPWHTARECFIGRLDECRRALGISGEDPVLDWFDATDRRHYVLEYLKYLPASESRLAACTGNDDAACIALMRLAPREPDPPLGITTRVLLLALALDAGGRNAFDRLLDNPARPLEVRLAAAAEIPVDSLIGRWRSRVLAVRPKTVAADERAAWGAVVWSVLFALAALRSSRWR